MANALYDLGREAFLTGDIDWATDDIKIALVDSGAYTPNLATHDFLDDVPSVIATSGNLASKTTAAGVADAADVTFSAVSGVQSEYILIYQDTGSAATSRLIALIDTATNLPITPNGGDIQVVWDSGVDRIFKL